jgi:DNA polymerase-1
MSRPILLIDAMNNFIRHFMANPQHDRNGELVGGTVGFMKALAALSKRLSPTKVFVIWEGGGSPKRLKLFPEYKQRRKPLRTNRFYGDAIPDTPENEDYQKRCIIQLLQALPVTQIYVENCEADDVIGYLCTTKFKDLDKIIVSSDKDFYQLLDEKTKIYRPGKKTFMNMEDVISEYNIAPKNFCVAKALNGDNSDNIPGVPRVGFKTLAKRFDFKDNDITIDDVINESKKHASEDKKPLAMYTNIVENEEIVRRNMKLMTLDNNLLSYGQIQEINKIVDEYTPQWNKIKFLRSYLDLELDGLEPDQICNAFHFLIYST